VTQYTNHEQDQQGSTVSQELYCEFCWNPVA